MDYGLTDSPALRSKDIGQQQLQDMYSTPKIELGINMCLATSGNVSLCRRLVTDAFDYIMNFNNTEYNDWVMDEKDIFHEFLYQLNKYFSLVIIAVGIVTNTLSVFVFLCTHLRTHSSSIYLASLAVADSCFLIALLLGWFSNFKIHIINIDGMCQLIIYVSYVSGFLSVYYVMAFTVERYIAIVFPFQRAKLCSVKKAKMCVIGLAVLALVLYSYSLWTNRVISLLGFSQCTPIPEFMYLSNAMLNVDAIITLVIPSFVIIILNICIAVKIHQTLKARRLLSESDRQNNEEEAVVAMNTPRRRMRRRSTLNHSPSTSSSTDTPPAASVRTLSGERSSGIIGRRRRQGANHLGSNNQLKTTRMLLVVSTVFVLLNAPSHAFRVHSMIVELRKEDYQVSDTTLHYQTIFQLLYYMNFSINFFLYSVYAKRFRQGLKRLCGKVRYKLSVCLPYRLAEERLRRMRTPTPTPNPDVHTAAPGTIKVTLIQPGTTSTTLRQTDRRGM